MIAKPWTSIAWHLISFLPAMCRRSEGLELVGAFDLRDTEPRAIPDLATSNYLAECTLRDARRWKRRSWASKRQLGHW